MRIVITSNTSWNIWNFRRPIIENILNSGHEIFLIAPEDEFTSNLQALGCHFLPMEMDAKGLNPVSELIFFWRLRQKFASLKPDAIFSYTIKNNIFGAIAAKSLGIPFLPTVTGLGTAFLSGGTLQFVAQWLYRKAFSRLPIVFFQNEDDRDFFIKRGLLNQHQARLIPGSGIDLMHFAPANYPKHSEPITFLMIARLLRDKGVYEYVEASKIVREQYPDVKFQLLGAADSANRTAVPIDIVRAWEVTHGIDYLGTTQDVRQEIARSHCVVLPSYREGAPRTLIEAAAMARPVIASDVPGCRAVVEDQKSGFLCNPRSGQSLASACLQFIALSQKKQIEMGLYGRQKIEREFDQRIVIEAYREALARATAG